MSAEVISLEGEQFWDALLKADGLFSNAREIPDEDAPEDDAACLRLVDPGEGSEEVFWLRPDGEVLWRGWADGVLIGSGEKKVASRAALVSLILACLKQCACVVGPEWSGSVNPNGRDDEWICDGCGRIISAA